MGVFMSPVLVMLASTCKKVLVEAIPLKYGMYEFIGRVDGEVRIRVRKSNEKAAGAVLENAGARLAPLEEIEQVARLEGAAG